MTQGKGISVPDGLPLGQPVWLRVLGAQLVARDYGPVVSALKRASAPGVTWLVIAADCSLGILECEARLPVSLAHFRITMESTPLSCL